MTYAEYHQMSFNDNELRILMFALNLMSKQDQSIVEEQYGDVAHLYEQLEAVVTRPTTQNNSMEHEMSEEEKENLTLDECFLLAIEEKATELEVTVDYYMDEFM